MKATFEADDQQETMRIVKSLDMANLIWYIQHNLRKNLKSNNDESLHDGIDCVMDEINIEIEAHGIIIDDLTD